MPGDRRQGFGAAHDDEARRAALKDSSNAGSPETKDRLNDVVVEMLQLRRRELQRRGLDAHAPKREHRDVEQARRPQSTSPRYIDRGRLIGWKILLDTHIKYVSEFFDILRISTTVRLGGREMVTGLVLVRLMAGKGEGGAFPDQGNQGRVARHRRVRPLGPRARHRDRGRATLSNVVVRDIRATPECSPPRASSRPPSKVPGERARPLASAACARTSSRPNGPSRRSTASPTTSTRARRWPSSASRARQERPRPVHPAASSRAAGQDRRRARSYFKGRDLLKMTPRRCARSAATASR